MASCWARVGGISRLECVTNEKCNPKTLICDLMKSDFVVQPGVGLEIDRLKVGRYKKGSCWTRGGSKRICTGWKIHQTPIFIKLLIAYKCMYDRRFNIHIYLEKP
jgi:hypothetical protein